jgi:hypothetical protein
MATSWDQENEQTTSVDSDTTTVTADIDATAVPSLDMGNRLQNLLTMIDNSEEAGMDFMKRVESSVRLLYGEYAANSMELLCADLNAVKLGGLLVQLARENEIELLHGVDFLRILGIDLLNITASPYTNFDALFADWTDDDEDNLETVCRHIYFLYGTYGESGFRILVTQLQREGLSLRGSISSILNNDYQGFYAWGNAALRLWTEYRLRLSPIDWDAIGGLPDASLSDVE